jgi:hypothetical protein
MADPWVLHKEQVLGKVIYARRGNRKLCVHGGLYGLVYSVLIRSIHSHLSVIFQILKSPYDRLAKTGALGFLPIKTKVLAFQRSDGYELQLFLKGHLIGRKRHGEEWIIKPPFRLFLKENALLDDTALNEAAIVHSNRLKHELEENKICTLTIKRS